MVTEKTKRINFFMHRFCMGGVEKMFINVAHQLSDQHLRLVILNDDFDAIFNEIPVWVTVLRFDEYLSIKVLRKINRKFGSLTRLIQPVIFLLQLLIIRFDRKFSADVQINFSDTLSTLIAATAGVNYTVSWIHLNPVVLKESANRGLYHFFYRRCKRVVCVCNEQMQKLVEVFIRIPSANISVIQNTIDVALIDEKKDMHLNNKFGEYLLMVARLDLRSKDFYTVIDAFVLLKKEKNIQQKMIFLGNGPDRKLIQTYIDDKRMSEYIHLVGGDTNPYKWMYNATVFVFSSKFEGFGLVLVEAMCCSVPVISTDCEVGPKEILGYGKFGKLVKTGNILEMRDAIWASLTTDAEKLKNMRVDARRRALEFDLHNRHDIVELLENI
jgi:glycosyltransferase involved in cell wall biosynthesis